jgi:hypothetical protein
LPWKIEASSNYSFDNVAFTVNLSNTGFNLLFEVIENLSGRIFFGVNYWPLLKQEIEKIMSADQKKLNVDVIVSGQKTKKLNFTLDKKALKLNLSRMQSDNAGLTWIREKDSSRQGFGYRQIHLPNDPKAIIGFIKIIDDLYQKTINGVVKAPMEGHDLFYSEEMARHDRSMLSFKQFFDEDPTPTFFLRLDENLKLSDTNFRIERGKVAAEARKAGISFLRETRGDDGFLTFGGENIVVDWEIRRDWVMNINNIPIKFEDRKKQYFAVGYPAPNPGPNKNPMSPFFNSLSSLNTYISKKGLHDKAPYFIYRTLGQFGRKMAKPEIMLSIQCSYNAPQWPIQSKAGASYFVAAWHEDFLEAGKVSRTTSSGAGEFGTYWDAENFGIFEFTKNGVELFKNCLAKQYANGLINDRNGNTIPKERKWEGVDYPDNIETEIKKAIIPSAIPRLPPKKISTKSPQSPSDWAIKVVSHFLSKNSTATNAQVSAITLVGVNEVQIIRESVELKRGVV